MRNFIKPGEIITFTSPAGGVVSGTGYLIGALFVVATNTVAATLPFEGLVVGEVTLPKATGAWTEGQLLYFDAAAKNVTTVSTSNTRIGCALAAAASGDTSGLVRLNGAAAPAGVV